MRPSIWEEDDSGKGSGPDILAEERERRRRRRRGIRAFFPSSWLTGRAGVFILVAFLLGGLGWLGFQRWGDAERLGPGSGSPSLSAPVPERARDLTASEYSLASRYGRPLYLGTEGVPVVQVEGTGKVRELTPFELKFDSAFTRIPSPRGLVIEVPGPRGWGMWWRDMSEAHSLRPLVSFDRRSWASRQERELSRVVRGVSLGMQVISGVNLELWNPGAGDSFLDLTAQIKDPYPPVRHRHWSAVPGLWVCDQQLERDLHQGLTPSCPGVEYLGALREAWGSAGLVVERMEGIARLVHRMDGMSSEEFFQSNVRASLSYEILDLARDVRELDLALSRLRRVSREWDLPIVVNFMGGS